jgi:hypothetical protein
MWKLGLRPRNSQKGIYKRNCRCSADERDKREEKKRRDTEKKSTEEKKEERKIRGDRNENRDKKLRIQKKREQKEILGGTRKREHERKKAIQYKMKEKNVPKGGMVCVGTAAAAIGVGGDVRAVARLLQQGHDVAISLLLLL